MSAAASAAAAQQILYRRGQQNQGGAFESRPPTQGESRRWERSGRFSKKVALSPSLIVSWARMASIPCCGGSKLGANGPSFQESCQRCSNAVSWSARQGGVCLLARALVHVCSPEHLLIPPGEPPVLAIALIAQLSAGCLEERTGCCWLPKITRKVRPSQVSTTASTAPEEVAAAAERAEAERVAYEALKAGLWRWSLGTTAACFGAAYAFYSRV